MEAYSSPHDEGVSTCTDLGVLKPVTVEEVGAAQKGWNESSPGPDRVRIQQIKRMKAENARLLILSCSAECVSAEVHRDLQDRRPRRPHKL